jgi:hypothetical protein
MSVEEGEQFFKVFPIEFEGRQLFNLGPVRGISNRSAQPQLTQIITVSMVRNHVRR